MMVSSTAKKSKYRNEKTNVDGIAFDSKMEAKRYFYLKLRERIGEISDLRLQVPYPLFAWKENGEPEKIAVFRADFDYREKGALVVEDVKGVRTKDYILKSKLFKVNYGFPIKEVK